MTIHKRTLIEPQDIIGIEYECTHCASRFLVPLKQIDRKLDRCPNCQEKWLGDEPERGMTPNDQTIFMFADYLKQIQARKLGVVIRLEIAETPAA